MKRRDLLKLGAVAALAPMGRRALAQSDYPNKDYPNKPVRIVVDSAVGSANDATARILADKLGEIWNQQVVIFNQPGAGDAISARAAQQAAPDGYTLYMPATSVFLALPGGPGVAPNLPVELPRDFAAIGFVLQQPIFIAASPKSGISSIPDLIARAKAETAQTIQQVQPQMSFLEAIRDVLPENGILCDEMTQAGYVSWFGFPIHAPRTLITSGFSGTLGAGFPTALGVKVAMPDRPVVALTGDGGFLFGGAELATAVQFGINLVTVLFNNGSYGNVLRDQRRLFQGRDAGSKLRNPDFQVYAKSFGVASWRVNDAEALRGALREALAANAPALIEVMTDITQEYAPWEFIAPGRG